MRHDGQREIIGDDPLQLKVIGQAVYMSDPSPYAEPLPLRVARL